MLISTNLDRIFLFENDGAIVELADPSPEMLPESVLNFYSQTYPELTTANIEGPEIKNDRVEFVFATNIGTKG